MKGFDLSFRKAPSQSGWKRSSLW